jgi:type 1 glutamine amidotransferase
VCAVALCAGALIVQAQQPPAPAPQGPAQGRGRGAGRAGGFGGGRGGPQNQVARVDDVAQMLVALPDAAPATPKQPRRLLVLGKAQGFVHSSIPLAARTFEALGNKTGAWTTVITYTAADITEENLKQYDAIVLDSTTGTFLDEPNNQAVTDARKKALLDFVRGGKGLIAIHAGTDSYHSEGNGGDPLWPEFNQMINGYFKWHWSYPTQIVMKVEDVDNPINASFTRAGRGGGPRTAAGAETLAVVDEVYTYAMGSWDRSKAHVLTSIDYAKMPAEVKAQEPANGKRTDGDYVLSYIQKEGSGRVFVELLGHHESIYKLRPMLEHILAGTQYALGDLQADDSPKK